MDEYNYNNKMMRSRLRRIWDHYDEHGLEDFIEGASAPEEDIKEIPTLAPYYYNLQQAHKAFFERFNELQEQFNVII